jgi:hypothetical protein
MFDIFFFDRLDANGWLNGGHMICVFGLEVSNKDKMLLDFEFGVFGSFAVSTNRVIICVCFSRCCWIWNHMCLTWFLIEWMRIVGILVCCRIGV